uniref:Uncharacterized protein n=1 Tax=Rhizophora mucronata TaxID=61149 RepID=A0A2P2QYA7_RHIMU
MPEPLCFPRKKSLKFCRCFSLLILGGISFSSVPSTSRSHMFQLFEVGW